MEKEVGTIILFKCSDRPFPRAAKELYSIIIILFVQFGIFIKLEFKQFGDQLL